jgi:sugar-phosphatase
MGTVVFVAGSAGTGKSTLGDVLATRLKGVHLDFDLVSAAVVDEARAKNPAMSEAELLEAVKDSRYRALHDALRQTLAQNGGTPIVVSAPFTRYAARADSWAWWADPCPRWLLVWLDLDEDERARRIQTRGAVRDQGARGGPGPRPGVPHLALDAALPTETLAQAVLEATSNSPEV